MGLSYKDAGVNIEAGNNFVKNISGYVKSTFTDRVITDIGGFGALFDVGFPDIKEPVLVSGTDGVGTKLKIAQMMDKHDTIGIDAVAMCVNDILVSGAKPLFFLDYISCGRLDEKIMPEVVKGIADGCNISGCSLIGGETAEHPGVMEENDYDIAGFSVGIVDKTKIIDGSKITAGDKLLSVESSGVHSNGFSLVRKLFFDKLNYSLDKYIDELGCTLGESLLTPTNIYCKEALKAINSGIEIKGMIHVTGGGFYENIPRILPKNVSVKIDKSSLKILPVFDVIQSLGNIEDREMFTTFNMGTGLIIILPENQCEQVKEIFHLSGFESNIIGEVINQEGREVSIID